MNFAKQWDEVGATDLDKNLIATKEFEQEQYFNMSGIQSASKLFDILYPIYGHELHNQVFLELGCGVGRETRYFSDVFDKIVAVDVSKNMIDKAKNRVKGNIDWVICDGKTIPIEDNSVDILYSFIVLQHCPQEVVSSYFLDIHRVLKPGGTFVFQLHTGDVHSEPDSYCSYSHWTMDEIRNELKGMHEVKLNDCGESMDLNVFTNGI